MNSQGQNADTHRTRAALLMLAQSASRYLRRSASPAVRLAAALLLAASLAACNASASDPTMVQSRQVAPLAQEVSVGLPHGPGSYEVVPGSIFRDQQGVYQFEWLDQGQAAAGGQVARASRLRLVRDPRLYLEIAPGSDPVLHLPETERVGLTQQGQTAALQAGPSYYPPVYSWWSPFYGYGSAWYPRPAYYDPPRTVVVDQSPSTGSGSASAPSVTGGSISETAKPPAMRVTGVQSAVSGRAGGTGAGNAVTSRNASSGAAGSASSSGSSSSAGSSAARAGTGSASSGSSSGVSAPRSGGFSGGTGSSGGSSVS